MTHELPPPSEGSFRSNPFGHMAAGSGETIFSHDGNTAHQDGTFGQRLARLGRTDFIGRSFELDLLRHYVRQLPRLQERIINVHGTVGMGKSCLLEQYGRIAGELGAAFVCVTVRDYMNSGELLCSDLAARLERYDSVQEDDTAASSLEQCLQALGRVAAKQVVVLAIDEYEHMGSLDGWFRQTFMPRLPLNALVVVAGRFPLYGAWKTVPALRKMIVSLPLAELSYAEARSGLEAAGVTNEAAIDALWLKSLGHPLSFSLLLSRYQANGYMPQSPAAETAGELLGHWLTEISDDELHDLLLAASVPRTFNRELLSELLDGALSATTFDRLIRLSFVQRSDNGWRLHETIREAARLSFREQMPAKFEACRRRAALLFRERLARQLPLGGDVSWELTELLQNCGNPVLRAHIRHSAKSANWQEPVDESNAAEAEAYIARRLRQAEARTIRCRDPETDTPFQYTVTARQSAAALEHLRPAEWLAVCPGAMQLLRSPQGSIVGLTAIMPIQARTLPFLANAPLSRAYFSRIGQAELQSYAAADSGGDKHFVYAMDVDNLEDDRLRSDMVRIRFELLLKGSLLLTMAPRGDYYETALRSFGFEPVPGTGTREEAEETKGKEDEETPLMLVYKADTRREKLLPYIDKLLGGGPAPEGEDNRSAAGRSAASEAGRSGSAAALPPQPQLMLTVREREVAELLVGGCTNEQIAKQLYISVAAVKKHVNAMLRKFDVHNRTQLAGKLLAERSGSGTGL